jgi:hypothetical protein
MTAASYRAMLEKQTQIKNKRRRNEDLLCMAFNVHLREYFPPTPGILIYTHIANEGRDGREGSKLKKMGVEPGFFDYIFLVPHWTIEMEAKVDGADYSTSQKTHILYIRDMPGKLHGKFYSVREGHHMLIGYGVHPIKPCTLFREPSYLTMADKRVLANDFFAPPRKP